MISREEAIKKLQDYWGVEKFVFQAEFHIPTSIALREGSKPFGYFRNIRLNDEILDYPINAIAKEKRISIYQLVKKDLIDGQTYEVEVELAKDEFRSKNPFSLNVKRYNKIDNNNSSTLNNSLNKAVEAIFNENININSPFQVVNLANSVESLATDIYSEDKRFIYELIQNADDAAMDSTAEIAIDILDNYVIISHNGAPFNSRDIRGLCSIGLGTKTNDATKTGYKGIGFKSVFGQPGGIVYVKSENTLFRFDREYARKKGWNEKWGNKEKWEEINGISFQCPWQMMPILSDCIGDKAADIIMNNSKYAVKTAIKINDGKLIYNNINSFFGDAKFLLFLRRIIKVSLQYKDNKLELRKVVSKENEEIVSLQKNEKQVSSWYVKNWVHNIPEVIQNELKSDPKTPKKIQSMQKTEISFALKLNNSQNNIELLEEGLSPLYSYLPTTVKEYNIPFIVNCNFLLDASREKIHKNRKWNEWLFQVIGYKMVECCSEFVVKGIFESTYLSIFRNGFYPSYDNLSIKINEGLQIGFEKYPIIRNANNVLCKLNEICFDSFDVNKVDTELPKSLSYYINETQKGFIFKADNLISLTEENRILRKFKPFELEEKLLQDFFCSTYIQQLINVANNYNFLTFLKPLDNKDASSKWYTVITNNKLILNQAGELDYIKMICFPMEISLDEDFDYKNSLIHTDVYAKIKNDNELIEWLEKLGVTEPSSIAYLEKEIIGNINNCITKDNYLELTRFIFKLHKGQKLNENHYINLQELPLNTNRGLLKANQCVLSLAYNPTIDFSTVLPQADYVSDEYIQISNSQECRLFFKALNVIDDIEVIKFSKKSSSDLPVEFVENANLFAKDGHSYPHLIGVFYPNAPSYNVSFYLQSFSFLEQTIKIDFSKLFWERVFGKYHITRDHSGTTPNSYCPGKTFTIYNVGGGLQISTLDKMNWGRQTSNLVHIPAYVFWFIQNVSCIPTLMGTKKANETFVNTESIIAIAGKYLPIININSVVPDDWRSILNLKTKLSLEDLLSILENLNYEIKQKNYIDKENEKRIGLIYNELISKLELDYDIVFKKINNWANKNSLVCTSRKCISTKEILHINISGFQDNISGIETIFLPKNVETNNPFFEELLKAFEIKIIDDFTYQAKNQKEVYDLKIKLLKLLGPICLLLKNKMVITDLDKSLNDRFHKISKTKFFSCQNIRPIFKHKDDNIEGEIVPYYYDKKENNFLSSIDWKNPLSLLEISYEISLLLMASRIEKEVMMLLLFSDMQVNQYLINSKLNSSEYTSCESYNDIATLIEELELAIKVKDQANIPKAEPPIENPPNEVVKNESNEPNKIKESNEKSYYTKYDEEEIQLIKKLFGRELDENELMEENLFAQVKALRYFKDNDYNVTQAEEQFTANYKDKYLNPIIDSEGNASKVMCRSARKGILFLGAYAWKSLGEKNTILFILTGDKSTDNIIVNNQHELEEELHSYYKVIRRVNTTVEDISTLVESEQNLKDMQFLYKVKSGDYDIIFNPKQNNPGETGGALTDIGVDDI